VTPIPILFGGICLGATAGILTLMSVTRSAPELLIGAFVVGGVGGLMVFIGLISWSVEIGVRAAKR